MYSGRLAQQLGRLLRLERERSKLTQTALAARAGVSQQCVSQFERGSSAPTTSLAERLFEALGQQLRLEVEELGADLDAAIDAAMDAVNAVASGGPHPGPDRPGPDRRDADGPGADADRPDADWDQAEPDDLTLLVNDLDTLLRWAPDLPYLIDGELAAALQGVPIRPTRIELAVARAELPRLADWIQLIPNCLRWVEKWRDFSGYDINPLRPGPLRWLTPIAELRVRLLPSLPPGVVVRAGGRELAVRPLFEVERDEPRIARTVGRARTRRRAQSTVGSGGPSTSSASTMV